MSASNDNVLESVEHVSICASTSSTKRHYDGEEDDVADGAVLDRSGGGSHGDGESNAMLKNLNDPLRPLQVDEFFHRNSITEEDERTDYYDENVNIDVGGGVIEEEGIGEEEEANPSDYRGDKEAKLTAGSS